MQKETSAAVQPCRPWHRKVLQAGYGFAWAFASNVSPDCLNVCFRNDSPTYGVACRTSLKPRTFKILKPQRSAALLQTCSIQGVSVLLLIPNNHYVEYQSRACYVQLPIYLDLKIKLTAYVSGFKDQTHQLVAWRATRAWGWHQPRGDLCLGEWTSTWSCGFWGGCGPFPAHRTTWAKKLQPRCRGALVCYSATGGVCTCVHVWVWVCVYVRVKEEYQ